MEDSVYAVLMGVLGSASFHVAWIVSIGRSVKNQSEEIDLSDLSFLRIKIFILTCIFGAAAGLVVFSWFKTAIELGTADVYQVFTYAYLSGFSQRSILSVLKGMVKLGE